MNVKAQNAEPKERVRSQFARSAERYAAFAGHADAPNLHAMLAAAELDGSQDVLDVGCGPGHTALAFAPGARSVLALDLAEEMLEAGRRLAAERSLENVRFERGDVEALPYHDDGFDCVTCRFSAHHYPAPERALAEMARVLKPGGRFLLVDSYSPEDDAEDAFLDRIERLRDPSHARNWRISEWARMLRDAGFEAKLRGTWRMYLDFAAWVDRMQTPEPAVAELRSAMTSASDPIRRRFAIEPNANWQIPVALLAGYRAV